MGFELEDCKNAYNKAKKKDLDTILDILSEEQEKKKLIAPKIVEKTVEFNVYNCTVCTFLNDPPAKFCAICGTEAPATAIKVDVEAEKKKLEEEAKAKNMADQKARF
jgi:rubrerythrin